MRSFLLVTLIALVGCHHSHSNPVVDGGPDAAESPDLLVAGADGGFATGVTLGQLMPQVVRQNPEGVNTKPTVIAVTYEDDPFRTDIETFYTQYAASTAWTTQTSEYGVGALTVGTPRHLGVNAPATLSNDDVINLLTTNLSGTTPAWGAPDTNTTYQFFIPSTVSYSDGTDGPCCASYSGYHTDVLIGGNIDIAYGVVCECTNTGSEKPLDVITSAMNHELVESVTDGYEGTPGWESPSNDFPAFILITTGEIADLCEFVDGATYTPSDMKYSIQRTYSNAAAMAGHDPCVGGGTTPFYETIPYLPDDISIVALGNVSGKGLQIPVGETATLSLRAFAEGATGPLTVTLIDYTHEFFGSDVLLTFEPSTLTVMPGQDASVQVTVQGADPGFGNAELFSVNTKSQTGPTTYYYGLIGQ